MAMSLAPIWRVGRSLQWKAVLTVTLSLALVMAMLFVLSNIYLVREQLDSQTRRSQDLMRQLVARLELGVMVKSPDLIRPIVQDAFLTSEVKAVAVFDAEGNQLLRLNEEHLPCKMDPPGDIGEVDIAQTDSIPWTYWVLAAPVRSASLGGNDAAPADFQLVNSDVDRTVTGTVMVYWDLTSAAQWLSAYRVRFLGYSLLSFVLVAIPTWLLMLYLNRGVSQLFVATQHVQRGNFDYRIGTARTDELGDVMRAFDSMMERTAQTTRQLEEQREQALSASKAKSEFLANMSHELRTPLNAIIGFSEVLLEPVFGELSEKQRSYIKDVLDSGRHLLSLINDILDLAKIEAGRMELDPQKVNIRTMLQGSLRLIAERATKHSIELSSDIEEDLTFVEADERKLKQLIFNLLSNAVKFTRDGGKVGVRAWTESDAVVISVWDTGIGIPASEHTKIFQDFYQVGNTMVKSQQGTGLGLSLVRKIAELHGGRVWVESEEGKGSEFFMRLPQPLCVVEPETTGELIAAC